MVSLHVLTRCGGKNPTFITLISLREITGNHTGQPPNKKKIQTIKLVRTTVKGMPGCFNAHFL